MLRYPAAERLNQPWTTSTSIAGWTFLFGVIPFSRHHLTIESIDEGTHTLVSNERGGLVKTWRHQLSTVPLGEGRCSYQDLIDIDAGAFTPIIAAYAKVFYRYRQRRWQRLARLLASSTANLDRSGNPPDSRGTGTEP